MEEEVRHILRNAANEENRPVARLGSRIAARFKSPGNILERAKLLQEIRKSIEFKTGIFIDLAQPNGRTAALLLDPRATSSVFRYPEFASLVDPAQDLFVYRTFKGATRSPP